MIFVRDLFKRRSCEIVHIYVKRNLRDVRHNCLCMIFLETGYETGILTLFFFFQVRKSPKGPNLFLYIYFFNYLTLEKKSWQEYFLNYRNLFIMCFFPLMNQRALNLYVHVICTSLNLPIVIFHTLNADTTCVTDFKVRRHVHR